MSKSNPTPRHPRLLLFAAIAAACAVVSASTAASTAAQPAASSLKAILAQMDASSATFRSAEASIKREQYDRIVHDTTTETGSIYFLRSGSSIQMGAKFDPPAAQTMEYKSGTLRIYQPENNHLETRTASGADQARFQTALTLGFGGSGADLAKAWNITDQGPEQIDGVKVQKLDLVSKNESDRNTYSHITIWIDPTRDVLLKMVTFDPGGNTNTITYSSIRYNQPIKDLSAFAIKCKGKCD